MVPFNFHHLSTNYSNVGMNAKNAKITINKALAEVAFSVRTFLRMD